MVQSTSQSEVPTAAQSSVKRDWRFWTMFLAITISLFTSALDFTSVSTALPTISNDLHGSQFVWVGSAYTLSSTAFLPMSGGLAQVFGRRPIMLASLALFAIGSALCGAAPSMNFLIAGRTVQGIGGGGIASLSQIIVSDLVSLQDRGFFNGLNGIAWSVACGVGPVIGGAFAERGAWRWLFYINIFTSVFAGVLIFFFLHLKAPPGAILQKLKRMDWVGNFIATAATSSCIIALTWGGVQYPWSSARVLIPLIVGLAGLGLFVVYEARWSKYPIVPFHLMSNITSLSGYIQNFLAFVVLLSFNFYMPVYFQACKGATPIGSGVDSFSFVFIVAPFGIISGLSVAIFKSYRPQLWFGWTICVISTGLLTLLKQDSSKATILTLPAIFALGMAPLTTTAYFPVLSPLPVSENALALAYFTFLRFFGQVWGITIGATVLQNELIKRLPADLTASFPEGALIAYSIIPNIHSLSPVLQDEVRVAFAGSLRVLWGVLAAISGVGLCTSLLMQHVPLHSYRDENWGVADGQESAKNGSVSGVQEKPSSMEISTA